jgi:hypothetical protein
MYGDTRVIRGLARRMRDQADDLRGEADRLVGQAEGVWWTGWAADGMRSRARARGSALRHTATLHDDAAQALERHADEVDRLQELIAWVERRVQLHQLLDRFVPPPHGHRDWLTVDLPGLGG